MEHLSAARLFMGDSLGFHIIFALLGVGLPIAIAILEFLAIRHRDEELRRTAKLWSYIAGVLVITGVLSGTVVALQMFLVWPGILDFGGEAIGLAFAWEGYAFILEAIFLGIYLKTWDTLKGWAHWLLLLPVVIGASLSAFLITSVDAWMNYPNGITVLDGKVVGANPMAAIFNETTYLEAGHSISAYYLTAILLVGGVLAFRLLRRQSPAKQSSIKLALGRLGLIAAALLAGIAVFGDLSARYLATYEPTKLAAIESLAQTSSNAPFIWGGLEVPGLLSWLVGGSTDTVVKGLDATPSEYWPPLIIHLLFDIKLVLIAVLTLTLLAFAVLYLKRSARAFSKPLLWLMVVSPIVSLVTLELGWMVTELGRQPYAVAGQVFTKDAVTTAPGVLALAWVFPAAYLVLGGLTLVAIRQIVLAQKGGAK